MGLIMIKPNSFSRFSRQSSFLVVLSPPIIPAWRHLPKMCIVHSYFILLVPPLDWFLFQICMLRSSILIPHSPLYWSLYFVLSLIVPLYIDPHLILTLGMSLMCTSIVTLNRMYQISKARVIQQNLLMNWWIHLTSTDQQHQLLA